MVNNINAAWTTPSVNIVMTLYLIMKNVIYYCEINPRYTNIGRGARK